MGLSRRSKKYRGRVMVCDRPYCSSVSKGLRISLGPIPVGQGGQCWTHWIGLGWALAGKWGFLQCDAALEAMVCTYVCIYV